MAEHIGMGRKNRAKIMARHDQNKMDLDHFMRTNSLHTIGMMVEFASDMTHGDSPSKNMIGHLANFAICELIEKHYDVEGNKKDV